MGPSFRTSSAMSFPAHAIFDWKGAFTLTTSMLMAACATHPALRKGIPEETWSPGGKYGITVPVFHFEDKPKKPDRNETDEEVNKVVSLKTRRVVAVLEQEIPAYDRA